MVKKNNYKAKQEKSCDATIGPVKWQPVAIRGEASGICLGIRMFFVFGKRGT